MSDLRQAIKGYILKCWDDGTQIDKQNIGTAVYLGGSAHFFLYFIYKYFFGLNENIYLRIVVVFLCVSVGVYNKLPEKVRKYWFPFYWHIMLIAALPFMLTFNLFNTNFHEAWLYWDIFMALLLALYVPNWLIYFIDLSLGIGLAFLCYIGLNHGINLQPNFNIGAYLIVFLFSATAGVMFTSANRNAWLSKQAAQHTRDVNLAAGIAHDIRSFVTKLKSLFVITSVTLADKRDADGSIHLTPEEVNNLAEIEKSAYNTARHAHHNIDDILSTIKGKPIDPTTFTYHNSNDIAQIAKTEFGYTNPAYEEKVKLDLKSDFIIKADESLLLSVLFNLMKNSFDFLYKKNSMEISIGTETFDNHNIIYVHDTGVGIKPDIIKHKLFKSEYTSGKASGTGIGLASCKRIVQAFGGDIVCDSEVEEYTRFSLIFPKLSEEESRRGHEMVKQRKQQERREDIIHLAGQGSVKTTVEGGARIRDYSAMRILLIDDEAINYTLTRNIAHRLGTKKIDYAATGAEGLDKIKENDYDLVLLDFRLGDIHGDVVTKQIRQGTRNSDVVILCTSSNDSAEEKEAYRKAGMNDAIGKVSHLNLRPAIDKWFNEDKWFINQEKLIYPSLSILVIDDFWLTYEKSIDHLLRFYKVKLVDGCDTKREALSLLNQKVYDLILLDLVFTNEDSPETKGFDIARTIRKGEGLINYPQNKDTTIFLVSGKQDEETREEAREIGINDFVGKFDMELLDRALRKWFREKGVKAG